MLYKLRQIGVDVVALHPEGVDRNLRFLSQFSGGHPVALHPEGVDRNAKESKGYPHLCVALHPEGVDRNKI